MSDLAIKKKSSVNSNVSHPTAYSTADYNYYLSICFTIDFFPATFTKVSILI